jgi:dipeptide transport system permease protein
MLSRLIYGARYSLFIGIVVVSIALVGGIVARPARRVLRRLGRHRHHAGDGCDPGLPSLLLALVLVAVLGPGLTNAMIAIAIVCSRTSRA